MKMIGTAHVYGNNIDTDRIIPGKYTKTLELQDLANHVLEDLDPDFRQRMVKGDIIVGGYNFGCGSSREQAPLALKQAGVSVVVAKSFARIFFRNAINIGLPLIEIEDLDVENGTDLEVELTTGEVYDRQKNKLYQGAKLPNVMIDILNEGGLVPYIKKHKTYTL